MKRFIALSTVVLILSAVAFTTTMWKPKEAEALSARLFGSPQEITFNSDLLVDSITVLVASGWDKSDSFSLKIEITGYPYIGPTVSHGHAVIPLSQGIGHSERATAVFTFPWTADTTPRTQEEEYVACVQILANGNPIGDQMCNEPPWVFDFQ